MFDDNDFEMGFHFLGDDDMSPEERDEIQREFRKRLEQARNHPMAKKAKEINTIVDALLESLEPDDDEDNSDPQFLADGEEYTDDDFDDDDFDDDDEEALTDEEEQDMLLQTLLHHTKHEMRINAITIGAKFAAIAASDSYISTMENAVLMKIAARNLLAQSAMLQYEGTADPEHIQVLRRAIEEFREVFVVWIAEQKPSDDEEPDGWGLFF